MKYNSNVPALNKKSITKKYAINIGAVLIALILAFEAYAVWYTYHRHAVIAERIQCENLANPETAPKMRAPDGMYIPVMTLCLLAAEAPAQGGTVS